jgi:uncharacterized low-complexity protein
MLAVSPSYAPEGEVGGARCVRPTGRMGEGKEVEAKCGELVIGKQRR